MLNSTRLTLAHSRLVRMAVAVALAGSAGCQTSGMQSAFNQKQMQQRAEYQQKMAASGGSANSAPAGKEKTYSAVQIVQEKLKSAEANMAKGAFGQAQQDYETVLSYRPDHADANHGLAIIADQQGQFQLAEQYYKTALRYDPNNVDLLANLGYSYLLQQKYSQSEDYLRQALEKNPQHRKASINLGDLYAQVGDEDRAIAMYRNVSSEADARTQLNKIVGGKSANQPQIAANGKAPNKQTQQLIDDMAAARERDAARGKANQRDAQRYNQSQQAQSYAQSMDDNRLKQQLMAIDQDDIPRNLPTRRMDSNPSSYDSMDTQYAQSSGMSAPDPRMVQGNRNSSNPLQDQRLPRPEPMQPYQPAPQAEQQYANSSRSNQQQFGQPNNNGFQTADYQQSTGMMQNRVEQTTGYVDQNSLSQNNQGQNSQSQGNRSNPFSTPWNVASDPSSLHQQQPVMSSQQGRPLDRPMSSPSGNPMNGQRTPYPASTGVSPQQSQSNQSMPSINAFDAAQAKAMQMGMNAGGGQMFPVDSLPNMAAQPQGFQGQPSSFSNMTSAPPQSAGRSMPGSDSFLGGNSPNNWTRQAPDINIQPQQNEMARNAVYTQYKSADGNLDRTSNNNEIQQLGGTMPSMDRNQQSFQNDPYQQQAAQHQREYQQMYQQSALSPQINHQPSPQQFTNPSMMNSGYNNQMGSQDGQGTISWQDHMYRQRNDGSQQQQPSDMPMNNNQPQDMMRNQGMSPQQGSNMQQSLPQWPQAGQGGTALQQTGNLPQWNPQGTKYTPTYNNNNNMNQQNSGYQNMPSNSNMQLPVISPSGSNQRY